ncbi:MAG: DUF1800 domain-containing protein [Candidatus Kapabacteria bacterium]|nr:DUF1800 domain-containing protein [Candidatus Kapabacteria bacterium]MCS7169073.1 DUF1800 domain-containing protein [Candidatus Kapabacteria bacterium]MDW7996524.1 DUF1800 domain-containing protein [Bacteroidota bacterium]MDW8225791.1 DUF1800 domain-containing protein [Bacteroidota bacterium]
MQRRDFLTAAAHPLRRGMEVLQRVLAQPPIRTQGGLEPYVPSSEIPWDERSAGHLLRRTGFQCTKGEIEWALSRSPQEVVDTLLQNLPAPEPPDSWVNEEPRRPPDLALDAQRMAELQWWWLRLMAETGLSLREKMVFFWHNHFTTDKDKVRTPQYHYIQHDTFRRMVWGNIRALTQRMVSDPAMLIYLDNNENIVGNPNENFARELLELFTLGVGNYTEWDVVAATRALTGWRVIGLRSVFIPQRFDDGIKTFLGQTGPWGTEDTIRIIFEHPECSRFFARKLYRFFVYMEPDEQIVQQLAQQLIANNFELKPVLRTLLGSAHFFAPQFYGAQIKSPLDFVVGLLRQFEVRHPEAYSYAVRAASALELELLNPPTVEGWKGHRLWITSMTLPLRQRIAEALIDGRTFGGAQLPFRVDALGFARRFASHNQARQFVRDVARFLLAYPITKEQEDWLFAELLQGSPEYEWSIAAPNADARIRLLLKAIVRLPEYQLT